MGLVNMRERALLIGAILTIISAPGQGCSVALSCPSPLTHDHQSLSG